MLRPEVLDALELVVDFSKLNLSVVEHIKNERLDEIREAVKRLATEVVVQRALQEREDRAKRIERIS